MSEETSKESERNHGKDEVPNACIEVSEVVYQDDHQARYDSANEETINAWQPYFRTQS